jgi:collagenase-like PrtC family protease
MRLTLGPLQYFWPRQQVLDFYQQAAGWPLDVIYVGETTCSKRRELDSADWLALAAELEAEGHEVVLSGMALLEAESELTTLTRLVENGRFLVEANDMSGVQLLRSRGLPFVGGPTLNIYNHVALRLLREDGLMRWVLGFDLGVQAIREFRDAGAVLPQLEVTVWGRLPLAWSARCFTARALDLAKDDCGFRCIEFPDGLPLATREDEALLTINGVQLQSAEPCDLGPELHELEQAGVSLLRIYPQAQGTAEVVARMRQALDSGIAPKRHGAVNGYWQGAAGLQALTTE